MSGLKQWRAGAAVALGTLLLATVGCGKGGGSEEVVRTNEVLTTFYPTTYLAERIAGTALEIVNPCPADVDPAYWSPDDETLLRYQSAALVLINGASFEKWVAQATLPATRTVDTTKSVKSQLLRFADAVTHSHGPAGEHAHEGVDGHTWLDPALAKAQATAIREALGRTFPAHAGMLTPGFTSLAADLDALDQRLRELSSKLGERPLLASHPAYNYLARRYGWRVTNLHLDPGEPLDDAALAAVRAAQAASGARILLWESAPLEATATQLRDETGVKSVAYSPCEARPGDGRDFLAVMNANIDRLAAALAD